MRQNATASFDALAAMDQNAMNAVRLYSATISKMKAVDGLPREVTRLLKVLENAVHRQERHIKEYGAGSNALKSLRKQDQLAFERMAKEVAYHRKCHDACHDEVERLRTTIGHQFVQRDAETKANLVDIRSFLLIRDNLQKKMQDFTDLLDRLKEGVELRSIEIFRVFGAQVLFFDSEQDVIDAHLDSEAPVVAFVKRDHGCHLIQTSHPELREFAEVLNHLQQHIVEVYSISVQDHTLVSEVDMTRWSEDAETPAQYENATSEELRLVLVKEVNKQILLYNRIVELEATVQRVVANPKADRHDAPMNHLGSGSVRRLDDSLGSVAASNQYIDQLKNEQLTPEERVSRENISEVQLEKKPFPCEEIEKLSLLAFDRASIKSQDSNEKVLGRDSSWATVSDSMSSLGSLNVSQTDLVDAAPISEPKSEVLREDEPQVEAAVAEEPQAVLAREEEPLAELAREEETPLVEAARDEEEPLAELAREEEPQVELAREEETPLVEAAREEEEPLAELAREEEPQAELTQEEEPLLEVAREEEPQSDAALIEEPQTEEAQVEEPEAHLEEAPRAELALEEEPQFELVEPSREAEHEIEVNEDLPAAPEEENESRDALLFADKDLPDAPLAEQEATVEPQVEAIAAPKEQTLLEPQVETQRETEEHVLAEAEVETAVEPQVEAVAEEEEVERDETPLAAATGFFSSRSIYEQQSERSLASLVEPLDELVDIASRRPSAAKDAETEGMIDGRAIPSFANEGAEEEAPLEEAPESLVEPVEEERGRSMDNEQQSFRETESEPTTAAISELGPQEAVDAPERALVDEDQPALTDLAESEPIAVADESVQPLARSLSEPLEVVADDDADHQPLEQSADQGRQSDDTLCAQASDRRDTLAHVPAEEEPESRENAYEPLETLADTAAPEAALIAPEEEAVDEEEQRQPSQHELDLAALPITEDEPSNEQAEPLEDLAPEPVEKDVSEPVALSERPRVRSYASVVRMPKPVTHGDDVAFVEDEDVEAAEAPAQEQDKREPEVALPVSQLEDDVTWAPEEEQERQREPEVVAQPSSQLEDDVTWAPEEQEEQPEALRTATRPVMRSYASMARMPKPQAAGANAQEEEQQEEPVEAENVAEPEAELEQSREPSQHDLDIQALPVTADEAEEAPLPLLDAEREEAPQPASLSDRPRVRSYASVVRMPKPITHGDDVTFVADDEVEAPREEREEQEEPAVEAAQELEDDVTWAPEETDAERLEEKPLTENKTRPVMRSYASMARMPKPQAAAAVASPAVEDDTSEEEEVEEEEQRQPSQHELDLAALPVTEDEPSNEQAEPLEDLAPEPVEKDVSEPVALSERPRVRSYASVVRMPKPVTHGEDVAFVEDEDVEAAEAPAQERDEREPELVAQPSSQLEDDVTWAPEEQEEQPEALKTATRPVMRSYASMARMPKPQAAAATAEEEQEEVQEQQPEPENEAEDELPRELDHQALPLEKSSSHVVEPLADEAAEQSLDAPREGSDRPRVRSYASVVRMPKPVTHDGEITFVEDEEEQPEEEQAPVAEAAEERVHDLQEPAEKEEVREQDPEVSRKSSFNSFVGHPASAATSRAGSIAGVPSFWARAFGVRRPLVPQTSSASVNTATEKDPLLQGQNSPQSDAKSSRPSSGLLSRDMSYHADASPALEDHRLHEIDDDVPPAEEAELNLAAPTSERHLSFLDDSHPEDQSAERTPHDSMEDVSAAGGETSDADLDVRAPEEQRDDALPVEQTEVEGLPSDRSGDHELDLIEPLGRADPARGGLLPVSGASDALSEDAQEKEPETDAEEAELTRALEDPNVPAYVKDILRNQLADKQKLREENRRLQALLQDQQLKNIKARQAEDTKNAAAPQSATASAADCPLCKCPGFDLLARLKAIWVELMSFYIDEVPDVQPIQDIEFICSQIDTSIQILGSYYHGFAFSEHAENPKRLAKLVDEAKTMLANTSRRGSQRS